jgi:hypothetical protein
MDNMFVTYEIALMLKEKGFDEPCFGTYNSFGDFVQSNSGYPLLKNSDKLYDDIWLKHIQTHFPEHTPDMLCTAPLWQQAIDWLKSKGILITELWDGWEYAKLEEDFTYVQTKEQAIEHALTLI